MWACLRCGWTRTMGGCLAHGAFLCFAEQLKAKNYIWIHRLQGPEQIAPPCAISPKVYQNRAPYKHLYTCISRPSSSCWRAAAGEWLPCNGVNSCTGLPEDNGWTPYRLTLQATKLTWARLSLQTTAIRLLYCGCCQTISMRPRKTRNFE